MLEMATAYTNRSQTVVDPAKNGGIIKTTKKLVPPCGLANFCRFGSSLNGNRTRISALRGLRPKPLDDKAVRIQK